MTTPYVDKNKYFHEMLLSLMQTEILRQKFGEKILAEHLNSNIEGYFKDSDQPVTPAKGQHHSEVKELQDLLNTAGNTEELLALAKKSGIVIDQEKVSETEKKAKEVTEQFFKNI